MFSGQGVEHGEVRWLTQGRLARLWKSRCPGPQPTPLAALSPSLQRVWTKSLFLLQKNSVLLVAEVLENVKENETHP